MNAAEVLHMNVSDVLKMDVADILRTDLGTWRVRPDRVEPLPEPEHFTFEPRPAAASEARAWVREVLGGWSTVGLGDEAPIDEALMTKAEFVVSEFVTRCLEQEAEGTLTVRCLWHGVHIELTSPDADFSELDGSQSLGTKVVEGASTDWGVLYTWPHYRSLWSDITA